MPVYEYLCQSCQHRFEVKQRMSDPPLTVCERCGQPVSKLISPPAIMFKGSGWYVTDYSDKLKPTDKADGAAGEASKPKEVGAESSKPAPSESGASRPGTSGASTPASTPAASSTAKPSSESG